MRASSPVVVVLLSCSCLLAAHGAALDRAGAAAAPGAGDSGLRAGNDTAKIAYFSLGCFWTSEQNYECYVPGVFNSSDPSKCITDVRTISDKTCKPLSTVVGYMGGTGLYPTYHNYTLNNNFSETVRVMYHPETVSYSQLLDAYWKYAPHPTEPQPESAYQLRIFYTEESQRALISAKYAQEQAKFRKFIPFLYFPADAYTFWKAEEYHQNYDRKLGFEC